MKNNTTTTRTTGNMLARTAALALLLGGFFLQGHATACPVGKEVQATQTVVNADYYQSSDNPFRGD